MPQQLNNEPSLMDAISVVQTERQMDREDLQFLGVLAPIIAFVGGFIAMYLAMLATLAAAAAVFISPLLLVAAIRHKEPKTTIFGMVIVTVYVAIIPIAIAAILSALALLFGLVSWQELVTPISEFSAAAYHTPIAVYIAICSLIAMEQRTHWIQKPFREWCDKYIYKTGPISNPSQRNPKDQIFSHTARQKEMIRRAAGLEAQPEMVDITPEISAPRTTIDFGEVGYVRQQEQPHDFDADRSDEKIRFRSLLKTTMKRISPDLNVSKAGAVAEVLHGEFGANSLDYSIEASVELSDQETSNEMRAFVLAVSSALIKIERIPVSSKTG